VLQDGTTVRDLIDLTGAKCQSGAVRPGTVSAGVQNNLRPAWVGLAHSMRSLTPAIVVLRRIGEDAVIVTAPRRVMFRSCSTSVRTPRGFEVCWPMRAMPASFKCPTTARVRRVGNCLGAPL